MKQLKLISFLVMLLLVSSITLAYKIESGKEVHQHITKEAELK